MLAGLPYVFWPVGSLFILASNKKKDPFLCYHGVQGFLFGSVCLAATVLVSLALFLVFRILPSTSAYIPGFLGAMLFLGYGLAALLLLSVALFFGYRASCGEMLKLPWLGDMAEEKMLDQTGMTRREFVEELEEAFVDSDDEEIPFPADLARQAGLPVVSPSSSHAYQADQRARPGMRSSAPSAQTARRQGAPGSSSSKEMALRERARIEQERRQAEAERLRQARVASEQRSQKPQKPQKPQARDYSLIGNSGASNPTVRDMDLVKHYQERSGSKDNQDSQANAKVLRSWLSSVDEE